MQLSLALHNPPTREGETVEGNRAQIVLLDIVRPAQADPEDIVQPLTLAGVWRPNAGRQSRRVRPGNSARSSRTT